MVIDVTLDLSEHFSELFSLTDIKYVRPYFIIQLAQRQAKKHLLSLQVLHTPRFTIEVLPWCVEYETHQFPWMVPLNPLGTQFTSPVIARQLKLSATLFRSSVLRFLWLQRLYCLPCCLLLLLQMDPQQINSLLSLLWTPPRCCMNTTAFLFLSHLPATATVT